MRKEFQFPPLRYIMTTLLFALPVTISPFLLGGSYSHIDINKGIVISVALLYIVFGIFVLVSRKKLFIPNLFYPLILLFAWSLLTLIPIPSSVLKIISPMGFYFNSIENGNFARPLTMSIPDTIYSALRLLVLMFFIIMTQRALDNNKRQWLKRFSDIICYSGAAFFATGIFFKITEIDFWLGKPVTESLVSAYPMINPNHAAAFLGISALIALTFAIENTHKQSRIFYGALFAVNFSALLMTLSKGGILAALSSILFIALFRTYKLAHIKHLFLPVLFTATGVFIAFFAGYSLIENEFFAMEEDYFYKFDTLPLAFSYFKDFWLTGSGLGSFMHVFPFYQANPESFFLQLENEPIQFFLENGILIGGISAFMLLFFIFKSNRGSNIRYGFLAVLFFVMLHNTVDFNLHNFATLFPVLFVYLAVTNSKEIRGLKKDLFLVISVSFAVFAIAFTALAEDLDFRKNQKNLSYENLIYNYPSDYKIPLEKAVSMQNSKNVGDKAGAGVYLSAASAKAPNYYFIKYLSGNYFIKLGAYEIAVASYRESLLHADRSLRTVLPLIYRDLYKKNMEKELLAIIPFSEKNNYEINAFLESIQNPEFVEFMTEGREPDFFKVTADSYLKLEKFDELQNLLNKIVPNLEKMNALDRGSYWIYKGKIAKQLLDFIHAEEYLKKGANIRNDYASYSEYAYFVLEHGTYSEAMEIEEKLYGLAREDKNAVANFYRWKSRVLMKSGHLREALDFLKKSGRISNNGNQRIEYAQTLAGYGFFAEAIEELKETKEEFPEAKTAELIKSYEEKVLIKNDNLIKEMLLKNEQK